MGTLGRPGPTIADMSIYEGDFISMSPGGSPANYSLLAAQGSKYEASTQSHDNDSQNRNLKYILLGTLDPQD